MAKKVLLQNKCLWLPSLKVAPSQDLRNRTRVTQEEIVVKGQLLYFDRVNDEVRTGERRPDIVMWKGDRRLLVEIVVTADLTDEKRQWIRENNLATIRVDLSGVGYDVNERLLLRSLRTRRAVNATPPFRIVRWIHDPGEAAAQAIGNERYFRSIQTSGIVQPDCHPGTTFDQNATAIPVLN